MIIVGLLLVALACLALGLILPSTAWLIASLIASVGAGYVLFRARTLIAGAHAVEGGGGKAAVLDREPAEAEPRRTRAQSRAEARAAKAAAAADERADTDSDSGSSVDTLVAEPVDTLGETTTFEAVDTHDTVDTHDIVDTHESIDIADEAEAHTQLIEPIADDATEVSGGELLADVSDDVVTEQPEPVEANDGDVWVIDGRPRYHLATCAIIQGQDAEPIPFDQATEDGFMPCSLCEPNVVRASS